MEARKSVNELLRLARIHTATYLPWFTPALFACKINLTREVQVAAISEKMNIYFNPDSIEAIAKDTELEQCLKQLGFLWIHEISHILRQHGDRAKEVEADPELWNLAADLEINDASWEGLMPPVKFRGCFPNDFNLPAGELAEFYYSKLRGDNRQKPPFQENYPDEGSGIHGRSRHWEMEEEAERSKECPAIVDQVRLEVTQLMHENLQSGRIPGTWRRWIDEQQQSTIDWRKKLKQRLKASINHFSGSRTDYTFTRPNRRQSIYHPFILPVLSGNFEPKITCVIDTSGSINQQQLSKALSEIHNILRTFRCPVTIIPCDSKAYAPLILSSELDFDRIKTFPGGGGTNMISGIEAALNNKPKPTVILVLTDGYTPYPTSLYEIPLVWGFFMPDNSWNAPLPPYPPWKKEDVVEIPLGV